MTTTCRIATLNFLWTGQDLDQRLALFANELSLLKPDILCLQEVAPENETQLIALLTQLGYQHHTPVTLPHPAKHWNLTFTKTPAVHEQLTLTIGEPDDAIIPAVITVTKIEGIPVHVVNAHLAWGSGKAGYRLRQVEKINAYAQRKKMDTTIILAGDLNMVPESSAMRYLTGLEEGSHGNGAMWIDAWAACGANPQAAITSDPVDNNWAKATCLRHNLDPNLVPRRRIDYILTHEWKYGGPGSPIRFGQFAHVPGANGMFISDHYGVWADIRIA